MIAFLGTGLLGASFVRGCLDRGDAVKVWNRTASKAQVLAGLGALVGATPMDAVRGVSRIHLVLLDDAAVDDVITQCLPALEPGAIILDHSTTAPASTAARAQRLAEQGVKFLHVPVLMGAAQALNATGMMLISGPEAIYEEVRPELARMTEKLRYCGERPDLAAAYKLFGNMMIMFVSSGLADVLALARGVGIDPVEACTIFNDFNPDSQILARGKRMAEGDYVSTFELSAARKDIRLMLETANVTSTTLHVLPWIARRFDTVIAAGHGSDGLAAIGNPNIP